MYYLDKITSIKIQREKQKRNSHEHIGEEDVGALKQPMRRKFALWFIICPLALFFFIDPTATAVHNISGRRPHLLGLDRMKQIASHFTESPRKR